MKDIPTIKAGLRAALRDFGLIPESALYIVDNVFADEEFIDAFLELGSTFMDGIGDMFQFRNNDKKLNYYGLLIGHLLKGQAVQQIALEIIQQFLKKRSYLKQLKTSFPLREADSESQELANYARALTMKQFYQLTQVEFTVTSVDIDSQLLRFFNHKTTPDLPVHKAVIMTGSFPVAFEALKWQPEWGKYYIHYDRWRREIDLTDHQFTDGGMLANFPVMYLDNESMRPMYFSHQCNYTDKDKETQIIGFGLEEIAEQLSESE